MALVASSLSLQAQIMMNFGSARYDISKIDSVVFQYSDMPSATTMMERSGDYSIFVSALRLTGLADSLVTYDREKKYYLRYPTDRDGNLLYYPQSCKIGFTVFAEKDKVFQSMGINNLSDLIAKCKEWYGSPQWYDYVREQNITVSTGDDFTNRWNVVNMFVAYHILRARIAVDKLVYEKNASTMYCWNYCFGYEPQTYYETMLPHTLMKVWQTEPKTQKNLWINRYVTNNTLTDQYGTFGSDAMHQVVSTGAKVDRWGSLEAFNANVHSIDKVMLYDQNTVFALHERMRFTANSMLPELANNDLMRATNSEISALNGDGDGNRVSLPLDYFENMRIYSENESFHPMYCVQGAWRALESSLIHFWGEYDYAIRLPHVPSGTYELRSFYPPMVRGGIIEFYMGRNSELSDMKLVDSLDATRNPAVDTTMCYVPINPEIGEYGIESGKKMHEAGFMYAPASFSRGTYNVFTDKLSYDPSDPYSACRQISGSTSCRTETGYGIMLLRHIIGEFQVKQGDDLWLRFKIKPIADVWGRELVHQLNFIELVPVDVVNNQMYMEDWY